MPPVGFELTISAGERPQTYALDRPATGTGTALCVHYRNRLVDHRQWASEHNTKIAECIIIYKNHSSGPSPLGYGIYGGRRFIPKWLRSYFKDVENLCNVLASRAVPVRPWYRLLFHQHNNTVKPVLNGPCIKRNLS